MYLHLERRRALGQLKNRMLYLGTGSNLGNRRQHLQQAAALIELRIGRIVRASRVYRTEAWGLEDQPDFYNQVLAVQTPLIPEAVLAAISQIEQDMGRRRTVKWRERLIDIDILLFNDLVVQTADLVIPHPFLEQRNFVLTPLAEIAPDLVHPVLQKRIDELLLQSEDLRAAVIADEESESPF